MPTNSGSLKTDELNELAAELVALCREAVLMADRDYNLMLERGARAAAKGKLLTRKLGPFGSVWASAFELTEDLSDAVRRMFGTAQELQDALTKGRLSSIEERVSAGVLADLVEHADTLIDQRFYLAAAVVLRAVLEERLRKLCEHHTVAIDAVRPTIETFKQALTKAEVIEKITARKIDWMAGVGNAAAHNLPAFNASDVPELYKATLDFLDRFSI